MMVKIITYLFYRNKYNFNLTHKNNLSLKFMFIFSFILLIYYKKEFNILFKNICKIPKLSVIIPIFNNAKYLSSCLNSVINQTLNNIEIICIDDGSKDESFNIVKNYSILDN